MNDQELSPVLWLTGLPCAGKSTVALALRDGAPDRFVVLDGDELRRGPCSDLGFSRADRVEQARRTSHMARKQRAPGRVVVVSTISPYSECRAVARTILSPGFLEIHVHASVETCVARDVKGQWALALRGALQDFTGVDDAYEPPQAPHIRLLTDTESIEQSVSRVLEFLEDIAGQADSRSAPGAVQAPTARRSLSPAAIVATAPRRVSSSSSASSCVRVTLTAFRSRGLASGTGTGA